MRKILLRTIIIGVSSTGLGLSAFALAQTAPRPALETRPAIDLSELSIADTEPKTAPNVIDFETVEGTPSGAGIALSNQYEKSHGLTFGRGASVHFCARQSDDVNVSLCPYPSAASGQRVAAFDVRSGGSAMTMNFSRAVSTVSMRINPTGGTLDEVFVVQLMGFDATGEAVAKESLRFNWFQDAFTWPTIAALETGGAQLIRVTVELRRPSQRNQAVRFLIDDLTLQYAPEQTVSPVAAALEETRGSEQSAEAEIVQSPDDERFQEAGRIFPAAQRIRVPIDWPAAEAVLGEQNSAGLAPAAIDDQPALDRATLPLILPAATENTVDIAVQENGDSYSAVFRRDGREYDYYGTRVFTVVGGGYAGDGPDVVAFYEHEYGLSASFSLFGASYRITRYCDGDAAQVAQCYDRDSLGEHATDLMLAIGATGEGRP